MSYWSKAWWVKAFARIIFLESFSGFRWRTGQSAKAVTCHRSILSHVNLPNIQPPTPPTHPLARRSLLKCQCLLLRSWLGRVRLIMVNTSHEHFTSCAHCVNCNCCCGCFGCIFSQKCVFFRLPAVTCCCEWVILPAAPPWQLTSWCSCFPFAFNNAQLVLV